MQHSVEPVDAEQKGVDEELAALFIREDTSESAEDDIGPLVAHVEDVDGGHSLGQGQDTRTTLLLVADRLEVVGRGGRAHELHAPFARGDSRASEMVALARLADGGLLAATEHWQRMGAINARPAKGQVLESEGGSLRIANIVVVVVETSGSSRRVRAVSGLGRLDL